jgi:hypothetical protein
MKIYEIIELTDGGPNDRGTIVGYIKSNKTKEELKKENNHGFLLYQEISKSEYLTKRKMVEEKLKMFDL